ncbi:hypothetical protein ACFPYJ_31175 [Paenibacillus solisilvae]|uniref:Uncharacterized protein n=1 Tax=Paenibacillus solisilvae TaxID=2486751 RepID=A0ABW0W910_9BACL
MRIKVLLLTMVTVALLSFSSSVSAEPGLPFEYGQPAAANEFYMGFIKDSSSHMEWYKWTNTASSTKSVRVFMANPVFNNYDVDYYYKSNDGNFIKKTAEDTGIGEKIDITPIVKVPAGTTIYWRVVPHSAADFNKKVGYWTYLRLF